MRALRFGAFAIAFAVVAAVFGIQLLDSPGSGSGAAPTTSQTDVPTDSSAAAIALGKLSVPQDFSECGSVSPEGPTLARCWQSRAAPTTASQELVKWLWKGGVSAIGRCQVIDRFSECYYRALFHSAVLHMLITAEDRQGSRIALSLLPMPVPSALT